MPIAHIGAATIELSDEQAKQLAEAIDSSDERQGVHADLRGGVSDIRIRVPYATPFLIVTEPGFFLDPPEVDILRTIA